MIIKYSNKELGDLVDKMDLNLSKNTIYYYSTVNLPSNMIQKQVFPDNCIYPFLMGNMLFSSERQCVSLILALAIKMEGKLRYSDEEPVEAVFLNKDYKLDLRIKRIYDAYTPYSSSRMLKDYMAYTSDDMTPYEKKDVCNKWLLFAYILAMRCKYGGRGTRMLYDALMATGDKFLCYAHPNDAVFGIRFTPRRAAELCQSPEEWKGDNYHGRMLMMVRDDFNDIPLMPKERIEKPTSTIIVRCRVPLFLKIHIEMIEVLLNMKDCIDVVNGAGGIPDIFEVRVYIVRDKWLNPTLESIRKHLLEYPDLEIV